ncbi:putative peptide modification system cyclase [Xanthomonas sp. JAI131]|uniref:putative peptide modification system cyclase n=1 Tax=Xanthomonas sp. JAI131 TaxID=2723067 RepID=UPI0015CC89B7|nr:putative peptide modification system cyclase [Xanthomonas sp. JAI131]NYF23030.1 putative peptide modification system cyclase [Xanthomonas sp. JAI131]
MNHAHQPQPDAPQLRTLLLTDLCDSMALVERLGDANAAELFKLHDHLVLELQQRWRGRLIDRSDGLLLLFERPIDGLGFALDYSRGLHALGKQRKLELKVRAGLHVGEVLTWRNSDAAVQVGAKPLEVEGLAKPTAARLMTLARPGQILLSAVAESLTHRAARELGERGERLLWKSHGRWRFKGVPTAQEIYEVGEIGNTPLRAPKPTPKAWRDIPLWRRPAALLAEVGLIAAVAVGVWFVTRPQPAIAFAERDWVVVGDLRNLTGDTLYDDTIETGLRISLEQSRYVNVLADARVREALKMMQRDAGVAVDRKLGAEIAQRTGARALLLPTVSDADGKVRISIEVVDPATEATVVTESATARGPGSAVAALGEAGDSLRKAFGESVASIKKSSAPLERVTTDKLDALRAFSLGQKSYAEQNLQAAEMQFRQALNIDPNFAMAKIGLARVAYNKTDVLSAQQQMGMAIEDTGRLTDRERLYAMAQMALFRWEKDYPGKWVALSSLYPDYHVAAFNVATSMRDGARFKEMFEYSNRAAATQAVTRPVALSFRAIARSALGDVAEAERDYLQAEALGFRKNSVEFSLIKAAESKFKEADAMLRPVPGEPPFAKNERAAANLNVMADQGEWEKAAQQADALRAAVADPHTPFEWGARTSVLAIMRHTSDSKTVLQEAQKLVTLAENGLHNSAGRAQEAVANAALYAGYVAACSGDIATAQRALKVAKPIADIAPYPLLKNSSAIVEARIAMQSGKPDAALEILKPFDQPWALTLTKVERLSAEVALGRDVGEQLASMKTLAWRGRVYAEWAAERPPVIESLSSPQQLLNDKKPPSQGSLRTASPEVPDSLRSLPCSGDSHSRAKCSGRG